MKRLFWYVLIGLALFSLILPGCAQETTKVTIATDATWPPFEYVNEDTKEIVGFDIDLIKAIAEKEDIEIEILNVAWDPLLAGVATCQYDAAISSVSITPERAEEMLFSDWDS
jgi:polar amino acid transport system substrate-binding protein